MDSKENEINYDYSSMSLIDSITLDKDIVRDIAIMFHHTIQVDTSSDIATYQLISEVYFPVSIDGSAIEEIASDKSNLPVFFNGQKWNINLKRLFSYSNQIHFGKFCRVLLSGVFSNVKNAVEEAKQLEQNIYNSIKEIYKTNVGELLVPSMHVDIEDNKKVYAYATISYGKKTDKVTFFYYLPCHTDYPKLIRGLGSVGTRLMMDKNLSFSETVILSESKEDAFHIFAIKERIKKQDIETVRSWATRKIEDMLFSIENEYKNNMVEIKKEKNYKQSTEIYIGTRRVPVFIENHLCYNEDIPSYWSAYSTVYIPVGEKSGDTIIPEEFERIKKYIKGWEFAQGSFKGYNCEVLDKGINGLHSVQEAELAGNENVNMLIKLVHNVLNNKISKGEER